MRSIRILIAEDEEPFQIIYQRLVRPLQERFAESTVTITDKLSEVMRAVSSYPPPDIVILDLNLRDSALAETIKKLEEIEEWSPLIIATGYAEEYIQKMIDSSRQYEVVSKDDNLAKKLVKSIVRAMSAWHDRKLREQLARVERMKEILKSTTMPKEIQEQSKSGSWEEYRMHHVKAIEWLTSEVQKMHDEILIMKLKFSMIAIAFGSASSIITAIVIHIVVKLIHKQP